MATTTSRHAIFKAHQPNENRESGRHGNQKNQLKAELVVPRIPSIMGWGPLLRAAWASCFSLKLGLGGLGGLTGSGFGSKGIRTGLTAGLGPGSTLLRLRSRSRFSMGLSGPGGNLHQAPASERPVGRPPWESASAVGFSTRLSLRRACRLPWIPVGSTEIHLGHREQ